MPSFVSPSNVDDIVNFTLPKITKGKWTDVTQSVTNFVAPEIIQRKDLRDESGGSDQYKINLQVAYDDNFAESGLWDEDRNTTSNNGKAGYVRYGFWKTNWAYDIMESVFNEGAAQIVDVLSMRKHGMYTNFYEKLERMFFTAPGAPSSLTDFWPLLGFPHWIQKAATAAVSLQGGNPSGWTGGCANVSSTDVANWKNVAGLYSVVDRADFVAKLSTIMRLTNWTPPHSYAEAVKHGKANHYHYCGEILLAQLETYLEGSNDNLGTNLLKFMDATMINGAPIKRVPILDTIDTSYPLYSVYLPSFKVVFPTGKMENTWGPQPKAGSHNVRIAGFDTIMQLACWDRRCNSVLSLAA